MSVKGDYFSKRSGEIYKKGKERALLVGVQFPYVSSEEVSGNMYELSLLADTAGAQVIDKVIQPRKSLDPAFYIGAGKVDEIKEIAGEKEINLIIFDDDLRPRQVKNLEDALQVRVIDRTELILDIFALRARTREAMIQVELAQLEYTLPRLKRMWTHLSKIEGGIGMRGPGETQLEVDKRLIKRKISTLKKALKEIETRRITRMKGREDLFKISLIGYTNAGKSTLLNSLTGADVFCENRLFATLETTTRKLFLKNNVHALLSDTVGFIKKLPAHLVASFRSTLEELKFADLFLHVIDISHPDFEEHIKSVSDTLKQIEVENKPVIYVFNKTDRLNNKGIFNNLKAEFEHSVFTSALEKDGFDELRRKIIQFAAVGE